MCAPRRVEGECCKTGPETEHLTLEGGADIPDSKAYIGIDVSSKFLDVAIRPTEEARQYTNDSKGIASLLRLVVSIGPSGVVLEATGGYELVAD